MSDSQNLPFKKSDSSVQTSMNASDIMGRSNEPPVLSVEQLNIQIKQLLEGQLGLVWLKAEISNFKAHTSGHFYFSLKDSRSQITAVMFRGHNSRLRFKPKDGLEVLVRARVTVYEPRGNYQLLVESMEPVGAGALQKAYEDLKLKLKNEGLFDPLKKKPIPHFPRHIAIVTSPTGAAIRDILNVLERRAPSLRVTIVPTVVQGESAAPEICEAFKKALLLKDIDAIIIGRGGGSIEDMWCFNDETLARLVFASPIPVISAVGHEIDFTVIDFVADLRAPTPSAAAELVAKSANEITNKIESLQRMLVFSVERKLKLVAEKARGLAKRLIDPKRKLQDLSLRNDDLLNRLELASATLIERKRSRLILQRQKLGSPRDLLNRKMKDLSYLEQRSQKAILYKLEKNRTQLGKQMSLLDSFSPLKVVERGYSIVTKKNEVIRDAQQVAVGDSIEIRLAKGNLSAKIESLDKGLKES